MGWVRGLFFLVERVPRLFRLRRRFFLALRVWVAATAACSFLTGAFTSEGELPAAPAVPAVFSSAEGVSPTPVVAAPPPVPPVPFVFEAWVVSGAFAFGPPPMVTVVGFFF